MSTRRLMEMPVESDCQVAEEIAAVLAARRQGVAGLVSLHGRVSCLNKERLLVRGEVAGVVPWSPGRRGQALRRSLSRCSRGRCCCRAGWFGGARCSARAAGTHGESQVGLGAADSGAHVVGVVVGSCAGTLTGRAVNFLAGWVGAISHHGGDKSHPSIGEWRAVDVGKIVVNLSTSQSELELSHGPVHARG